MSEIRAYLLFTAAGLVLILTKYNSVKDPELLRRLLAKGLNKFVAHEIPIDAVKANYSAHFEHVLQDPKQTDELRVLDDDGERIFRNVSLKDLGPSICYESQ